MKYFRQKFEFVLFLFRFINIWKNINSFSSFMNHNKNYTWFINWDNLKYPHIFHLKQKKSYKIFNTLPINPL